MQLKYITIFLLFIPLALFAGFNEDATSFYQEQIVPYLLGGSLMALVAAIFMMMGGRPEGGGWAAKVCIALILAANAERIIRGIWEAFAR